MVRHLYRLKKKEKEGSFAKWLDRVVLIVAFAGPLSTLPQIFKIFYHRDAYGVSALSWGFFGLLSVPWLLYGIVHKDKPIIISSALWVILDSVVLVGALVHG